MINRMADKEQSSGFPALQELISNTEAILAKVEFDCLLTLYELAYTAYITTKSKDGSHEDALNSLYQYFDDTVCPANPFKTSSLDKHGVVNWTGKHVVDSITERCILCSTIMGEPRKEEL